ncbi:hypothetical protein [Gracilibacillus kekensis]|uniref:Uncharacterized protein n=1 Tax=Gracilibacillus kekensis TaxID=1027249 RepID=A0A1M7LD07_9BACI|nr:hypothetical protein [Gracilibacillus kekensis]SHM75779.1 hypothetical protein SAMN05216179_1031 [Gracilibacillus kekensis]
MVLTEPRADLYRNGKHIAYSTLPATFPVENGIIEVSSGSHGINRMHYVNEEEKEYPLLPDTKSIRGLRLKLDDQYPTLSKWIGFISICTLLVVTILGLPQIAESLTQIPWVADNIGTFESPIKLGPIDNIIIAGLEHLLGQNEHFCYVTNVYLLY